MLENIALINVFESVAYVVLGFATALLSLEAAWHFAACKIPDKSIKPCLYKQIRVLEWKSNVGHSNHSRNSLCMCTVYVATT
jgi:hypothetical protein